MSDVKFQPNRDVKFILKNPARLDDEYRLPKGADYNMNISPSSTCKCVVCKKICKMEDMEKRKAEFHCSPITQGKRVSRTSYYSDVYVCKDCDAMLIKNSTIVHVVGLLLIVLLMASVPLLCYISDWLALIPGMIFLSILYESITGTFSYNKTIGDILNLKWYISLLDTNNK